MKQLLFCIAGIFFTVSSFAQFTDTVALNAYIRDTIRDRRPEKVTAAQLQKALLGTTKFLHPNSPDAYYFNNSGTPYTNTAEVLSQIPASVRYPGQTVNVEGVEYWFQGGTADGNLVVKLSGRSSGPYWLTNANTTGFTTKCTYTIK